MIKITVRPEVEQALVAAFPQHENSAKRALAKYVKTLETLVQQALLYGQNPAQRKLGTYSISLQRLANLGGQIGPKRKRVHAWFRENGFELVQTVTQGSNLTGRLSDVKFTNLVGMSYEFAAEEEGGNLTQKEQITTKVDEAMDRNPEQYDALEVDQRSLRSYIQWLTEQANLMSDCERLNALHQARSILAAASSQGGVYYQRKKPSVFGRMYYEGISIQNVNKELRRAILGDCWEYDICSSVIAWKMGFAKCCLEASGDMRTVREVLPTTTGYLEDKADFMRTIRHFIFLEGTNVSKELQTKLLKQAVTAISFGARATTTGWYDMAGSWTNPALVEIIKNPDERNRFLGDATIRRFIQEQNILDNYIFQQFKKDAGDFLTSPFLLTPSGRLSKSKVLAFYYQQSETNVMNVLREAAAKYGYKPLANVHDAVFFRKQLGVDRKSEIEFEMQKQTANPYFKLSSAQLQGYKSVSKEVIAFEEEHRARIAKEEQFAAGYESAWGQAL
jgi:hypothetical protein